MIVYEVNLTVDQRVKTAFMEWLVDHIRELLEIDGFVSATSFEVDRDTDDDKFDVCVHYKLNSRADLDSYLKNHSARMRADGLNKFPQQFTATRRIMQVIG